MPTPKDVPCDAAAPPDRELLADWQERHVQAAFAALVERHSPMVHAVCRRVLGNAAAADDATQATFLVLARRAGRVPGDTTIAGWLHGVALNMARHSRRTEERRRHHEQRVEGVAQGPEDALDWSAVRGRLDEALSSLNAGQRAGIVGYFLEGRSQAEVATQLGISQETLRARIHSAVGKLRAWFGRRGIAMTSAVLAAGLGQELSAQDPGTVAACLGAVIHPADFPRASTLAGRAVAAQMVKQLTVAGALALLIGGGAAAVWACASRPPEAAPLVIVADGPARPLGPTTFGVYFEEVNRAGDGGLLAEMIGNRSFEDDAHDPRDWTVRQGSAALDRRQPLNDRNPTSLRLEAATTAVIIANRGVAGEGLALRAGERYHASFYARCAAGAAARLTLRLESAAGRTLAEAALSGIDGAWRRYEADLTPSARDHGGSFVLESSSPGAVLLDMVSLAPATTWKGHGLRSDLAEMIAALRPGFVRFPGGGFVTGARLSDQVRWKDTIGDPAARRGNWCMRGYQTTGGLGLQEYLQWCEDLGAEPCYVITCGIAGEEQVPLSGLAPYVQDALDLIEYANGPATSPWGARRAAAGHPLPYRLRWLEIGNGHMGGDYAERFARFRTAIKAAHPEIRLIACGGDGRSAAQGADLIDEHWELSAPRLAASGEVLAQRARGTTPGCIGEYGVRSPDRRGDVAHGLAEAAFVIGVERNAEVVAMASGAVLLSRNGHEGFGPALIRFDQERSLGTPAYHVHALLAAQRPTSIIASSVASVGPVGPEGARRFLDGEEILAPSEAPLRPLQVVVGRAGGDLIVTAVNLSAAPLRAAIDVPGDLRIAPVGRGWEIHGEPGEENTVAEPERITARPVPVTDASAHLIRTFAPHSLTVLRLPILP